MHNASYLLLNAYYKSPKAIAFKDDKTSLTYEELFNEVINKASYIKSQGIINKPIIVLVDRSINPLIWFLAILLSNNSYVPLDENIPVSKLSVIIDELKAEYYVSDNDISLPLTRLSGNAIDLFSVEDFEEDFKLTNDAYIVFTSGSTGTPKGVIKTHENIISFVDNFVETFTFLGKENIANQAPFFFDASMKDLFISLKLGATLFIPSKTTFSLPTETIKYLNDNKITYICWVPSALQMIAKTRMLSFIKPEYLKYVYFVGEVFQPKYLNMWVKAMPNVRFFNIFGSSEVMGVSLYYEIKSEVNVDAVPLGKPLKNNTVELINDEIVITSKQVAKGYLNIVESRSFKDGKLYTGDYGAFNADGDLVFVGRKDFQIKHLGYRIELQEIEAALTSFEYIDQCCAVFDDAKDAIILFVSLTKNIEDPTKAIIDYAKEKLQFYMVPNKVVVLDKLPLNNNGKIDRTKLKEMRD